MRAYQDLGEFLSVLEQEQQLLRITDQVKFEPDLAAAACALARMGENSPAIIFNNIAGCSKCPGCDERAWLLAQSCPCPRHG
ncbi:MAG: vanillate/4-hydroxybenzoate decarboxylase subunit, partial [Alphaproteobacteria bacterium]|nr:vanillate/4-hydroxybenzoate decarboxylase subunit [Alphaproteobacteria bacterium]